MATTIKTKNSNTQGQVPSSLEQGELAINVNDGKLFYGDGTTVQEFTGSANPGSTSYEFTNGLTETNNTASIKYGGTSNVITDADTFNTADNDASVDKIIVFHDGDEGVQDATVADFKTAYDIQDSTAYNADSASFDSRIDANALDITNLIDDFNDLEDDVLLKLNTTDFNAYTSSQDTISASFDTRIDALSIDTGSFATTGSNTFEGGQTINGDISSSAQINALSYLIQGAPLASYSAAAGRTIMGGVSETSFQIRTPNTSLTHLTGSNATFSGNVTASFFEGDGSRLTNLPGGNPFPFTGSADISGSLNITNNNTSPVVVLQTNEDGSDASPIIEFFRNSATPANSDYLGQLKFQGNNSSGNKDVFAKITAKTSNVTAGDEDGLFEFEITADGSNSIVARLNKNGLLLNDGTNLKFEGANIDAFETTLDVVEPTQDNTVELPNDSGLVLIDFQEGHSGTTAGDYRGETLDLPTSALSLGRIIAYNGTYNAPNVISGSENVLDSLIIGTVNTDPADGALVKGTFTTSQNLSSLTNGSPLYLTGSAGALVTSSVEGVGDVDVKVGYVLDNTTNKIWFSPETAKKKEPESTGSVTPPTAEEWCYQRIYPHSSYDSYTYGDTPWHIQTGSYNYNYPSGNNITLVTLDLNASESQVRSGTFYGPTGDGSDRIYPTLLTNNNQFGNKYRFTDDAGNKSDSTAALLYQHTDFNNHSFTGATDAYVIDHLHGIGFNIDYYQSGSAFNMRASDGGVTWETWMDYIANADFNGYTGWRPYSTNELATTSVGAYLTRAGGVYEWADDFFTAEATQGGATRFTCLTGETDPITSTNFIYGEDTNTVDLTDDTTKNTGTAFTHRIMNCFMVRNHY